MSQATLQKDIVKLMGIDALTPEEQALFIEEIGEIILDTALVRLVAILTEDEHHALSQYLETNPKPEVMMEHLITHYKKFEAYLEEAVIEFKDDALAVL